MRGKGEAAADAWISHPLTNLPSLQIFSVSYRAGSHSREDEHARQEQGDEGWVCAEVLSPAVDAGVRECMGTRHVRRNEGAATVDCESQQDLFVLILVGLVLLIRGAVHDDQQLLDLSAGRNGGMHGGDAMVLTVAVTSSCSTVPLRFLSIYRGGNAVHMWVDARVVGQRGTCGWMPA